MTAAEAHDIIDAGAHAARSDFHNPREGAIGVTECPFARFSLEEAMWHLGYKSAHADELRAARVADAACALQSDSQPVTRGAATVANLTHEQLLALRPLLTDGAALFCYATATVICRTGPLEQRLADLRSVLAILPTYAAAIEARDASTPQSRS